MSQQWSAPAWAVVALAALVLVVAVALVLQVRSARRLDRRICELEERLAARAPEPVPTPDPAPSRVAEQEFVITHLGDRDQVDVTDPAPVVPAPVFADLVLREGAVQAVTLAAGLRRALSPETRHRIRFEMRRELKRARKQRRADLRAARRDLHARERAAA